MASAPGSGGGDDEGLLEWLRENSEDLRDLVGEADALIEFVRSPLRFLRGRAIPAILGALFGFVFNVADAVARPFDAVLGSLRALNRSLDGLASVVLQPIRVVLDSGSATILAATEPLGALQPFVVTAIVLLVGYALVVAGIRLVRAVLDSIPIASGVETFIWG